VQVPPQGCRIKAPAAGTQGLHRGLYAAPRQQRPRRRRAPPGTAARRPGPEGCRPGRRREAAPETVAGQERSGSSGEPRGDRERGRGDGGLGVSGKAPQADQSCAHRLVEGRARLPAQDPEEAPVVQADGAPAIGSASRAAPGTGYERGSHGEHPPGKVRIFRSGRPTTRRMPRSPAFHPGPSAPTMWNVANGSRSPSRSARRTIVSATSGR
jgi:hypothetical protein